VTAWPFRELYETARGWSAAQRSEVLDVALESRTRRDDLLAGFHGGLYAYDLSIDIGAYRDLHRHRRCYKFRQSYTGRLGYDTPALIEESGATAVYRDAMEAALSAMQALPAPGAHYLLPFGARGRFLFKMDFAEAEYIARVRSGVKGHFSYRQIACSKPRPPGSKTCSNGSGARTLRAVSAIVPTPLWRSHVSKISPARRITNQPNHLQTNHLRHQAVSSHPQAYH
jgi:hypothetical protein